MEGTFYKMSMNITDVIYFINKTKLIEHISKIAN